MTNLQRYIKDIQRRRELASMLNVPERRLYELAKSESVLCKNLQLLNDIVHLTGIDSKDLFKEYRYKAMKGRKQ